MTHKTYCFIAANLAAAGLSLAFAADAAAGSEPQVKNIILLIADGAGYNTLRATDYWTGTTQPYAGLQWVQHPLATFPGRKSPTDPIAGSAGLMQQQAMVYDPQLAWNTAPQTGGASGYPYFFAGYKWLRDTDPDSANTMTAMVCGVKTYNNAINVNGNGTPLLSLPEVAKSLGKSTAALSSVPFVHATPAAGGGAHNINRNNYHEIAQEMFAAGVLDVIGGGGNPDYDTDGNPVAQPDYLWIPETIWTALEAGTLPSGDGVNNWTLVQERKDIEALVTGPVPAKLAMIPTTFDTLQQTRSSGSNPQFTAPGDDPLRTDVPSLETMALVALNAIGDNANGFYLHVEGGAVDWAMHDNQFGRMIEEHMQFNDAIEAIVEYLNADTDGNNWANTLVVITADHDHMLFGPNSDTIPFQELVDNGGGVLPGYRWHDNSHSNQPVPLFARGPSADQLAARADQLDAYDDGKYQFGHGLYLHQSELGQHLLSEFGAPPCLFIDSDANEAVNVDDLVLTILTWGPTGPADSNGDGQTDIDDLLAVILGWGACQP
jgi:alkaline phosphatase